MYFASIAPRSQETPPRMRGIHFAANIREKESRNTPADAGNTFTPPPYDILSKKHPRGCGEYKRPDRHSGGSGETPPRMRGILRITTALGEASRNTPADAGNTCLFTTAYTARWKHPRGCGEYIKSNGFTPFGGETPPRMRGIRGYAEWYQFFLGNTPADAGNTKCSRLDSQVSQKHPRGCGEYLPTLSGR